MKTPHLGFLKNVKSRFHRSVQKFVFKLLFFSIYIIIFIIVTELIKTCFFSVYTCLIFFQWDEKLEAFTVSIRVQHYPVISDIDDVYKLTCAYGEIRPKQQEFNIQDPNFVIPNFVIDPV